MFDDLLVYQETSLKDVAKYLVCRVENFIPFYPKFAALASSTDLLSIVEEILGAEPIIFKDKVIMKQAGGTGFRAHQDYNYGWSAFPTVFVNALISIDAATPENGCIEFAPGSHRKGTIGDRWWLLSDEEIARLSFVPVSTQPGDVVLFHSLLVHRSSDNLSDADRSVLYLTFNRRKDGNFRDAYYANFPKIRRRFMMKQIQWLIHHNRMK
jgi:2-aminoethylphosphonate dioxygenase